VDEEIVDTSCNEGGREERLEEEEREKV